MQDQDKFTETQLPFHIKEINLGKILCLLSHSMNLRVELINELRVEQ